MQHDAMLPAPYASAAVPAFDPNFYNGFGPYHPAIMSTYGSPVSSMYQPFYEPPVPTPGAKQESSPPSDPAEANLSPIELLKKREKRIRNNEAAKQSRIKRSAREKDLQDRCSKMKEELAQFQQREQQFVQREQEYIEKIRKLTEENENLRNLSQQQSERKAFGDQTNLPFNYAMTFANEFKFNGQ